MKRLKRIMKNVMSWIKSCNCTYFKDKLMGWAKKTMQSFIYLGYLLIITIVILETTFRILPTSDAFLLQKVTDENNILRLEASKTITNSLGADFYQLAEKQTNNYGFVSSFDYLANSNPDVIVIGDSYVEAMQVDNEESIGEVISRIDNQLTVYQMGISGVSLSQYLKMLAFAESEFGAKEYVIVVVGNDFDESLCGYRIKGGTWCFDELMRLRFIPFHGYSKSRYLARHSAFLRYVFFNLGLNWREIVSSLGLTDTNLPASHQYAGNTERFKSESVSSKSRLVIDRFFETIVNMGLQNRLTIVLDADRSDVYQDIRSESYFNDMRDHMLSRSNDVGVNIIDLDPIFRGDYKQNAERFEFPTDGHWNERGHRLAAEAFLCNRLQY